MTNGEYKQIIIGHLLEQGYRTFATRFNDIDFIIADMYEGSPCQTAFMIPGTNKIVINPGFFELKNPDDPQEQKHALDQISVLCRHELLHFLLEHEYNFIQYLKKKYPKTWGRHYANPDMHRIANFAMDYDVSNQGYEPEDKDIIKTLTLNGEYIGGLVTEENVKNDHTAIWFNDGTKEDFSGSQFNGWENKSMEDMWQMLHDAHENYTNKRILPGGDTKIDDNAFNTSSTGDKEYDNMYNKIMKMFKDGARTKEEAEELFGRLFADEDIDIDSWKWEK